MAVGLNNLTIETAGTEEEAAEGLAASPEMEVEEDRGARARKGVMGLKGQWETLNYSLRIQSRAEPRSLMPVMGSTS